MTWETPTDYTIRIPRPLTPDRAAAVQRWLKVKRKQDGPIEEAWGQAGKSRYDESAALIEALPWFDRWNDGEEPMAIWKDIHKERSKLNDQAFLGQLIRVWERMQSLSPEGVRPGRPSKAKV
jgi:hypothetical protein